MAILGIETSCDETSVGIVDTQQRLLGHIVLSQIDLHQVHGGVVPEIAARSHLEATNLVCRQALEQAHMTWADIEAVGVTYGAGLAGSLLMGVATAKTLAVVKNKPLYACNHVGGACLRQLHHLQPTGHTHHPNGTPISSFGADRKRETQSIGTV